MIRYWGFLLSAVLVVCFLISCSRTPPEQAIRENIQAIQQAIEARDNSGVRQYVSPHFTGYSAAQTVTAKDLQKVLAGYFLRYRNINMLISQLQVTVNQFDSQRASAHFSVVLTGGQDFVPDSAKVYKVTSRWISENGEWRLLRLEW